MVAATARRVQRRADALDQLGQEGAIGTEVGAIGAVDVVPGFSSAQGCHVGGVTSRHTLIGWCDVT